MGIIAALVPNPVRLHRLRLAIAGRHALEPCESWAALTRLCEHEPVHLAVLDLYADGELSLEHVRHLKRRFPRLSTVAYIAVPAERTRELFDIGRVGIDALALADVDDAPRPLAAILEQAEARGVAALVRGMLGGVRPSIRDAVLIAVTRAHERLSADRLAQVLALSRRVLARRLAAAGFPPPHQLVTWGRLVVAAHLLEDANRSADGVALALHFPSGSAFRNTCQRYLRATPQQVRTSGGAAFVMRMLLEGVESARARPQHAAEPPDSAAPAA